MSSITRATGEEVSNESNVSVPDEPSRDDLFHVLRNQRRRFVIHHLKHTNEAVDIGNLATQVAAWENGVALGEVTSRQRRRVYNALQQTHLPELEDTGIVEVDRREVALSDYAGELDIYLEVLPGDDIPWSEYYLSLGALGTVGIAVTHLNVGPFAAVPDVAASVFLATAILVCALANYLARHPGLTGDTTEPLELRTE